MAAKTHADALKAKQKRQKIFVVVGAIVLVGLLVFQVPRVMKQMHHKTPAAAPASTTTTPATPAATAASRESASLATPPTPVADGQLASFSRFSSKDPFKQQIGDGPSANDDDTNPGGGSSSGASGTADASASSGERSGTASSATAGSGSSPHRAANSAVISVNGTVTSVKTGTDFPQPSAAEPNAVPLFHLVSQTATTARIAIVGGSYSNGAAAVTLSVNKPVTLMNMADGTRYKLVLKPRGTAVRAQG
jgi:hypothetical protein